MQALIASIQVGLPREVWDVAGATAAREPWCSGIWKDLVAGPVRVGPAGCDGDGQADLVHHGGLDKAVLAYAVAHYPIWNTELAADRAAFGKAIAPALENPASVGEVFSPGGFGENLTLQGTTEQTVCIGDVWRSGQVLLQVSQPRQPCWKLGRRWGMPELPRLVVVTGRSGWYLRVLREGVLEAGLTVTLDDRPHPQWSVARVASIRYDKVPDRAAMAVLAQLPELSASWRDDFARRLDSPTEQGVV